MGTLVDDVGKNLDSARGLGKIDAPGTRAGKITHRVVANGCNPDVDAPTVQRYLRDDHGIETAGGLDHALTQLDGIRHADELSSSEQAALAARLSRSSDSSAVRAFVDDLDSPEDVRHLLDEDTAAVDRMAKFYAHRGANSGQYRNIDPDLSSNDILQVGEKADIHGTNLIVKRDGELRWIEQGNSDFGWRHIEQRHIQGVGKDAVSEDGVTSFWPIGQRIETRSLPNKMNPNEINDLIYKTIKDGETSGGRAIGKTEYMLRPVPQEGIKRMRVVIRRDGSVETAFPEAGNDIAKWNDGWVK
ncbi:hypothetical protein [Natrinema sp. SYSU A 869]|uniref:hypothetical protein n=1 Tax=Natrinema sp. SYSU A 869 TaxID=2871694 RepID=UPI001CA3F9DE|nr:hypothetical protein [Natrinema sp. SYSU A 869]